MLYDWNGGLCAIRLRAFVVEGEASGSSSAIYAYTLCKRATLSANLFILTCRTPMQQGRVGWRTQHPSSLDVKLAGRIARCPFIRVPDKSRPRTLLLATNRPNSLYQLLGLDKDASDLDIKAAYRAIAPSWHPDRMATNKKARGEQFQVRTTLLQHNIPVSADKDVIPPPLEYVTYFAPARTCFSWGRYYEQASHLFR